MLSARARSQLDLLYKDRDLKFFCKRVVSFAFSLCFIICMRTPPTKARMTRKLFLFSYLIAQWSQGYFKQICLPKLTVPKTILYLLSVFYLGTRYLQDSTLMQTYLYFSKTEIEVNLINLITIRTVLIPNIYL